ncbi:T9SS type A sorting domain-containing protein [Flavobacterium pectinovorum]|uniref:T9SS type A sorting domain-containing protein n=1 Tax=Flavobacterium pectinovorum TaxID=29533 RepID=UPI001FAB5A23|nr:T9SS type A sorting domain-containing protein [Flavobacterium pectinovorum]MCI9845692.1 T9SS type A sorting domain-containing protein [Flavobacterium pectinovorum]
MKKMLKLSLVAVLLFTGISTYAIDGNEDYMLHVIKGNGKEVTFAINNVTKANISIYDQDGTLIYSEKASGKNGILKTFSFEEFPEGTYFLKVEDSVKTTKHEITIKGGVTVLSSKAVSSVYKAGFSGKNSNVAVR